MTLNRRDLRRLSLPALVMLLLVAVAGLAAWYAHHAAEVAGRDLASASSAMNRAEQRLRQARTEEQDIRDRSAILERLQAARIVGEEQRLEWVELLRDVQRDLRLPGLKYEFGPQAPLAGSNGWHASTLRIQFRLLHEGDLLDALARIERQAKALVIVRGCKLSPLAGSGTAGGVMAQLAADCEMQWLTAHLPGKQP